jgi:hypothetical protein
LLFATARRAALAWRGKTAQPLAAHNVRKAAALGRCRITQWYASRATPSGKLAADAESLGTDAIWIGGSTAGADEVDAATAAIRQA